MTYVPSGTRVASGPFTILVIVDKPPGPGSGKARNLEVDALIERLPPWPKWAQIGDSSDASVNNRLAGRCSKARKEGRITTAVRSKGEVTGVWVRRPEPPKWANLTVKDRCSTFITAYKSVDGDMNETARILGIVTGDAEAMRARLRRDGLL